MRNTRIILSLAAAGLLNMATAAPAQDRVVGVADADALFTDAAVELTERLLELYRPEMATGYYSRKSTGELREHSGLLDGAAGVALALLAASTPVEPAWDHVLLLS